MTKEQFREWRQRFGLTQDDAAEKFGVKRNTIQNWESGASALPTTLDGACEVWSNRLKKELADIGPVTLIYADAPMFINPYGPRGRVASLRQEPFATNAAALARVKVLWGQPDFHGPFIIEKDHRPLWNQVELMRVVDGSDKGAPTVRNTIAKVGKYVLANSERTARDGRRMLTSEEAAAHKQKIETVGNEINALSAAAEEREVSYPEFEALLSKLHKLGFYPPERLVGDVAHAITGAEVAIATV
jgi:transcriptional regulator with XRE-family HTH domain